MYSSSEVTTVSTDRIPRMMSSRVYSDHLPAASQVAQQMQQQQMPVGPMAPGQDPSKMFKAEAENLAVIEHYSVLDGIEERLLQRIKV